MSRLTGRTAVITGASKGLGKAMASAFAAEGAAVALLSRDAALLQEVVAEIHSAGGVAQAFPTDVTREEEVQRAADSILERFGHVHILVNNAGINRRKPIGELTVTDWREVMDTNVTSAFLMCRAFVPHLRAQRYGRILNVASTMAHVALPHRMVYCASKAALLGITRSLALELASDGVTVNSISPGPFITEMNRPLLDNSDLQSQILANVPLGRWGKPEEIGPLAVYLCSEESGFVTGADVLIDGGWTAR
jgi:NAD(P)-dependent dehydrogenase (short-subunit alcohol dehydrogenase family)